MRTPKEFNDNLKNGIITEEMLDAALYSANKRAKNWRDNAYDYESGYDKYNNAEKCRIKSNEYYTKKEYLLSFLKPICMHKKYLFDYTERVYDYESDYWKKLQECKKNGTYVRTVEYFERVDKDDFMNGDYDDFDDYGKAGRYIKYFLYTTGGAEYAYHLLYKCGEHTYHSDELTRNEEKGLQIAKERGLEVIEVDFDTYGEDISDLISVNFINKVVDALKESKATVLI